MQILLFHFSRNRICCSVSECTKTLSITVILQGGVETFIESTEGCSKTDAEFTALSETWFVYCYSDHFDIGETVEIFTGVENCMHDCRGEARIWCVPASISPCTGKLRVRALSAYLGQTKSYLQLTYQYLWMLIEALIANAQSLQNYQSPPLWHLRDVQHQLHFKSHLPC